ncbi:MAG: diacylglycerol kinase family protein [Planctomycetota bacterium]
MNETDSSSGSSTSPSSIPHPDRDLVLISRNPKSGASNQSRLVDDLAGRLHQSGLSVIMLTDVDQVVAMVEQVEQQDLNESSSSKPNHPSGQRSKLRAVVAAGGDGTVSLLANRLPKGTPLAILPLGTENLLAKHLKINADVERVAQMILDLKTTQLDAGQANGKLFLVMASCGFDADVVQRLHANRTGHIRHWSYALPIIRSIRKYRYPTIRISIDGQPPSIESKWAFIFNVPRYAMNLPIVAEADPTDGKLDVCTFRGRGLLKGLYYFFAVWLGKHRFWTNSQTHQFQTLRLESDEPVPFQLDGDPGGTLPLEVKVLPNHLTFVVP